MELDRDVVLDGAGRACIDKSFVDVRPEGNFSSILFAERTEGKLLISMMLSEILDRVSDSALTESTPSPEYADGDPFVSIKFLIVLKTSEGVSCSALIEKSSSCTAFFGNNAASFGSSLYPSTFKKGLGGIKLL